MQQYSIASGLLFCNKPEFVPEFLWQKSKVANCYHRQQMVIASVGFASVEIASVGIANSESLIVRGALPTLVTTIQQDNRNDDNDDEDKTDDDNWEKIKTSSIF